MPSVTELLRTLVTSLAKSALLPIVPMTSMFDPLLASATTSLPLKSRLPMIWSALFLMSVLALLWATTYTAPAASVPESVIVEDGDGLPLL
ncbi:MAG: hypothetical protein BWY91_01483 [bacterium ADurb.BinA028]|nr:MAG: hypothetical protein BWY91_01483 [bacterium ADurb.BinA028]